jgi:hypothetical protein
VASGCGSVSASACSSTGGLAGSGMGEAGRAEAGAVSAQCQASVAPAIVDHSEDDLRNFGLIRDLSPAHNSQLGGYG